ncbi:MAG: amidohydrolase family protein [Verrucomicrobiales bacterium]|nr:amidohydrolase family protein [Verrucomicrobiales bacterium]
MNSWLRTGFLTWAIALAGGELSLLAQLLPPGHRPLPVDAYALTNARVVLEPGRALDRGVIVVRRGRIEAVGENITIPPDAELRDLQGATVYAGLIESYLPQSAGSSALDTAQFDPVGSASSSLTSGRGIQFFGVPGAEADPGNPGVGYELAVITPERRVADRFAPDKKAFEELREQGFAVACLVPDKGLLRGQSALVALGEGNPNELLIRPDVFQHVALDPEAGKDNAYPRSLMGAIAAWRQAFFDAAAYAADRAASDEGSRRSELNPSLGALAPALAKKQPVIIEPGSVLMLDRAARTARELGLEFSLVASGQEWRRPDLFQGMEARLIVPLAFPVVPKLTSEDDWRQVSLDQLRAWDWAAENPAMLRQKGVSILLTTFGLGDRGEFRKNLRRALDRGLSENDALAALTTVPAQLCGVSDRLGTIATGKWANLTVVEGAGYFDPEARVREVWIDGRPYLSKKEPSPPPADKDKAKEKEGGDKPGPKPEKTRDLERQRVARAPLSDRGPLTEPAAVLIKGATVWTCGPAGVLENASLLVVNGKIQALGSDVTVPAGLEGAVIQIDGNGRHLTPGMVDAHSHSMILGSVNESTLPSTAMVRIGDVINSEAPTLYQQLAGGLTVANQLHGSANPIGGQNAVIKLRDGATPEGLKFQGAPEGIKFALGENVKQSNWGEKNVTRFPQTRMGVPTFYANRFTAARQYLEAWKKHRSQGARAPRRDLELEALGEILEGKRLIHCHSYRQDEILAFLRVMEEFGIQVATLQHVLEGYKVADEIARHGAGGSCFSDWWAYKFEVYDAIPHAGSLMHQRGVLVSFNSDSSDLARRMNIEAAKAVKYGGTSAEEALKFVTLNPARQLRIESRVGSLEVGKDGDFVLWSRSPLDSTTVCQQTWIEGRKYFDRDLDVQRTRALQAEWTALVDKAKKVSGGGDARPSSEAARAAFFRRALETAQTFSTLNCQDCLAPRH